MAIISPFKALRPQPQFAKAVASPPYDVLNSKEAKAYAMGNPSSFLHVTKSEIDLPGNTDVYSPIVYEKAKENLEAFIQRNILFREEKACYYIYKLIMNNKSQTGLVCISSLNDYDNGIIKKHEFTRPDKELDRINHIKITGAQTGNVFLAYRNVEEIDSIIEQWTYSHNPVYDFVADDSISHTIWVINDEDITNAINELFLSKVPYTYIADGHHRAASASKVRTELQKLSAGKKSKTADDNIGMDYFLTTLFPSSQLQIMDYNRVVKDLNGLSGKEFLDIIKLKFNIQEADRPVKPTMLHHIGMFLEGKWYELSAKEDTWTNDPIGVLDITILQNNILEPVLGIKDQRTDKRIDFIGGIRGLAELEKRVNTGEMKVAFSLFPVSIQQLFDIADSGNVMPPKSTWFEPKLRDGLLTALIYE